MRALATLAAAAIAATATPALAGPRVTLNGVDISGLTNERIENCTVEIDAAGNLHIEAKGYSVRAVPADPPKSEPIASATQAPGSAPAIPERLTRRYFLVTEQSQRDGTQFDIALFVNAKWIGELKSSDDQVVLEVTKYLHPGPNRIVLAATKRIAGERHSRSPDVTFKIIIGEGSAGGDRVLIDNPLVEAKRTAAEMDDVTEEFTLVAR